MNYIDFWMNGPPHNNILIYNADKYDEEDLTFTIEKTDPTIVIIYNIYLDNEKKLELIKIFDYLHHFYTKNSENKSDDSGIIILSNLPIIIYSNTILSNNTVRINREISFTIDSYQFKISMDKNEEIDGYNFYLKYVPTLDQIIHTRKKVTNKIILLKAAK